MMKIGLRHQDNQQAHPDQLQPATSRREFLTITGMAATGLLVTGCQPRRPASSEPAATSGPAALPFQVAVAQAATYDRVLVRQKVGELLDGLGGLGDKIRPGDKVAIKVNLTSGNALKPPRGVLAIESYVIHPEVIRALGELLHDAGAGQLYIVEAIYDADSFSRWGYEEIAKPLGATLVDLNFPEPYGGFDTVPVGEGWYIYQSFYLNHILQEVDVFISVTKMKCHYSAGVTLSMKNLVGLTPVACYRLSPDEWWRSALHGDYGPSRLPRVIVDINRARPIHLALIDGIMAAEGGEVPRGSFAPVEPHMIIAGKNPVATDAVSMAAMGFDPAVDHPSSPFLHGDNYLNLAHEKGLGTNHPDDIKVVGASIDDVRFEFAPSTR